MTLEAFGDGVVVEPVEENATSSNSHQPEGLDTFDSDEVIEPTDENKFSDSQVNKLEDQEDESKKEDDDKDEDDKDKDKEDKDPESEKDEKDDEKKSEEKEEERDEKQKGKTLRVKDSEGKIHELDGESTVKVKVKGKSEFVSIEELKSNFSGKKVWTEEIEQAKEKTKQAEIREEKTTKERNDVISKLEKVASMLDDKDANPLQALYYLVDTTGRDTLDFNKRVMDHLSEEVHKLDGMDDTERQLYWRDKEVAAIRSNQAAKADQLKHTKAQEESVAKVNRLRESHGVTEDQFVESNSELVSLGHKNITPEQVVNYSVMKPHYESSEKICGDYEEDMGTTDYDALVDTVANTLKNYPRISQDKALRISLDQLGYDYEEEDAETKRLNDKANAKTVAKVKETYKYGQGGSDAPESFEDLN